MLLTTIIGLSFVLTTMAQISITTLQHGDSTQVFYGQNSFVQAYNASVNGDTLNLSAGYFDSPTELVKGITVIGSGHFPEPASVVEKRTMIVSGLTINEGADSLKLEGLYIAGDLIYSNFALNYIKIIRCGLNNVLFQSSSLLESKNYCSFEECFIQWAISFSNYGDNLLINHCVFFGSTGYSFYSSIKNINQNALIQGNIFLNNLSPFYSVKRSLIRNNIIYGSVGYFNNINYMAENCIYNNIFVEDPINFGYNSSNNNYIGILQSEIFVNPIDYAIAHDPIDYSNDYHLKNPEIYIGTDGTQVGIYGGTIPFKEGGLPSNPQIISKSIATETDANGNLNINFTVKAQEN